MVEEVQYATKNKEKVVDTKVPVVVEEVVEKVVE